MIAADKAAATAFSLGALLPAIFNAELTTPVLGVGSLTVLGATFGAAAALGYDENRRPPRGRMFVHLLSTIVLSCICIGWIPRALGWAWATGPTEAALAGFTAFVLYYAFPTIKRKTAELFADIRLAHLLELLPWRRGKTPPPPPEDAPPGAEEPEK